MVVRGKIADFKSELKPDNSQSGPAAENKPSAAFFPKIRRKIKFVKNGAKKRRRKERKGKREMGFVINFLPKPPSSNLASVQRAGKG